MAGDTSRVNGDGRVSTGIQGLDTILDGGYLPERTYMVRGKPGTGKSITGLHYLTNGAENGEDVLYINLEEEVRDIRANAASLGFDLDGIEFLDLSPDSEFFVEDQGYDIFGADEVEQPSLVSEITDRVESTEPDRVFVDPLTQLRYLTADEYQFRKQVLAFMQFLKEQGSTVLFTSQDTPMAPDDDLQFISDGTIDLSQTTDGRKLQVLKFRGSDFRSGIHSFRISSDGITVFPSLVVAEEGTSEFERETVPSGVREMDEMLHGGIDRGTVTILSGAAGVGKTTTGLQFMKEAAKRGERSVVYSFEENRDTLIHRSQAIGVPITEMLEAGTLVVEEPEPEQLSADEFASRVRSEVTENDTSIVMIDGIDGYQLALAGQDDPNLNRELHKLSRYLKNQGVTVILVNEMKSISGDISVTEAGISYLADTVVFLRHLEIRGELRKAIGVLKKRTSDFEHTLREFCITEDGIQIGEPLTGLRGIMQGTPNWVDTPEDDESG